MTRHENALVDNLQDAEMELDQWKIEFRELEAELRELKRSTSTSNVADLSPELAEIAAGVNEKAAPG